MAASRKRELRYDAHETARMHALEGVPLATFRARAAALFVDLVPVIAIDAAWRVGWTFHNLKPTDKQDVHIDVDPFHGWSSLVVLVLYFGLLTWFGRGRTPGKRLLRLRVVSTAHERLTLWQCIERSLGYMASALEGGFGFVQYFIHPNRMCVHDRIAETIVVDERRSAPVPAPDAAPRD